MCGSGSCRDETGKKQKKTLSMLNLRKELSIVLDDSPEAWDIPFQEHVFGVPEFIPRCEVKEEEPCDLVSRIHAVRGGGCVVFLCRTL